MVEIEREFEKELKKMKSRCPGNIVKLLTHVRHSVCAKACGGKAK